MGEKREFTEVRVGKDEITTEPILIDIDYICYVRSEGTYPQYGSKKKFSSINMLMGGVAKQILVDGSYEEIKKLIKS